MVHQSLDLNQLVQCPFCQTLLQNHEQLAWQSARCPCCRNEFVLPGHDLPVATPVDMDLVLQLLSRLVKRPVTNTPVARLERPAQAGYDAGPRAPDTFQGRASDHQAFPGEPTGHRFHRQSRVELASEPVSAVAPPSHWRVILDVPPPSPPSPPSAPPAQTDSRLPENHRPLALSHDGSLPSVQQPATDEPDIRPSPAPKLTLLDRFRANLPAWNTSLLVHVALIAILALVTYVIDYERPITLEAGWLPEEGVQLQAQTFDTTEFKLDVVEPSSRIEHTPEQPTAPEPFVAKNMVVTPVALTPAPVTAAPAPAQAAASPAGPFAGRHDDARQAALAKFGGTAGSENAVARGLAWLKEHQLADGSWQFAHQAAPACRGACRHEGDHRSGTAATALGLLPFLGAGHTHRYGKHQPVVERGLTYLLSQMTRAGETAGDLRGRDDRTMYNHGLAAIAVCEAYAMTRDEKLKEPAQLALDFITYAQDPEGGGWRYEPRERGDTSVVGWQLMALKSGHLAGLHAPKQTIERAGMLLDSMSDRRGAFYGYQDNDREQATTAIGLLCRMYTGWGRQHAGLERGVAWLDERGPSQDNMYYNYYATQVLLHWGGAEWKRWNGRMRDYLIAEQSGRGQEAGSWYFEHDWSSRGGRVYDTSLAILILEVYYRHLPIYRGNAVQDAFEAAE